MSFKHEIATDLERGCRCNRCLKICGDRTLSLKKDTV